jgi:hypothetical protein
MDKINLLTSAPASEEMEVLIGIEIPTEDFPKGGR